VGLIDLSPEKHRCIILPTTGRPWPKKGPKRHKRRISMLTDTWHRRWILGIHSKNFV